MPHASRTPERLNAFSDRVFAVLITVLVRARRPLDREAYLAYVGEQC